jgi:hypothetical protein
MLAKMPENWWANLVCALIMAEEKSGGDAEKFLSAWVARNPNFFSYLDLAYYYQLRRQPGKAAAAMLKATQFDANTSWGHGGNSEYRGYTAAAYAFRSGQYQAAIKLCDKLLPVKINGTYAKQALLELRHAAQQRARGAPAELSWPKDMPAFDPFENLSIGKLVHLPSAARSAPISTDGKR